MIEYHGYQTLFMTFSFAECQLDWIYELLSKINHDIKPLEEIEPCNR